MIDLFYRNASGFVTDFSSKQVDFSAAILYTECGDDNDFFIRRALLSDFVRRPFQTRKRTVSNKKRPFAALSLRICGTARFELDGQKFVSMPGDVLFIPSDMDYTVDYSVSESIVLHLTDCNYTHAENLSFHAEVFLRKS